MHGLVALDGADRVLRPAILWNDQRTAAECAEIEQTIGLERLISLTGNRALPGFTAPKLLWLRRHEPDVYARIARIALPKDYVRLRLCGEHATDVSDASGTLLLDVAARSWSEEVLGALELDPSWLPPVLESPAVSGSTADGDTGRRRERATRRRARSGSASIGPGRCRSCSAPPASCSPRWSAFAADSRGARPRVLPRRPGRLARDGRDAVGGRVAALAARHDRSRRRRTTRSDRGGRAVAAGTEGLMFLPYLAGERTPHADPDARGAFTGLSVRHDRGALVRAVLEGVAYRPARLARPDRVDSAGRLRWDACPGGGARSDLWLAIVASVLELPLQRVAVDEGAAFGAAILGGVAAGVWPDVHAAVAATVRGRELIEPVDEWVEVYRDGRERFRALYPALRTIG